MLFIWGSMLKKTTKCHATYYLLWKYITIFYFCNGVSIFRSNCEVIGNSLCISRFNSVRQCCGNSYRCLWWGISVLEGAVIWWVLLNEAVTYFLLPIATVVGRLKCVEFGAARQRSLHEGAIVEHLHGNQQDSCHAVLLSLGWMAARELSEGVLSQSALLCIFRNCSYPTLIRWNQFVFSLSAVFFFISVFFYSGFNHQLQSSLTQLIHKCWLYIIFRLYFIFEMCLHILFPPL